MTGAAETITHDRRTIIGVFGDQPHAEETLSALREAGFLPEQISVIVRSGEAAPQAGEASGSSEEGVAAGALTGGILGGLSGFLVGMSALVIPGIGPIVGGGIILATIAGAGIGAATGGLIGALAEAGVPEEDARDYEAHVLGGRVLLTVHAASDEQARAAHAILETGRGGAVRAYGTGAAQSPMATIGRPAMGTGTDMATSANLVAGPGARDRAGADRDALPPDERPAPNAS